MSPTAESAATKPVMDALPPEIREMIYKPLLDWSKGSRTPGLFAAASTIKNMREELIKIFKKANPVLILNETNEWSVDGLPEDVLLEVKHLMVHISTCEPHFQSCYWFFRTSSPSYRPENILNTDLARYRSTLMCLPHLEIVDIKIDEGDVCFDFFSFFPEYLAGQKLLKRVNVSFPPVRLINNLETVGGWKFHIEKVMQVGIERANKLLNSKGKLASVSSEQYVVSGIHSTWVPQAWIWEAEEGCYLQEVVPLRSLGV